MSENNPVVKLKARERGQGLVEFALILPLFLLLVWGIIEFGRLLVMYTEVSNAAREAVRYGVARGLPGEGLHYLNCDAIADHGRAVTAMVGLEREDFEIAYDRGEAPTFAECVDQPPNIRLGDRMVITVTHEIRPLVLFQNAGPFRLQFTAARTIVHMGMPMERVGSEGGIEEAPELEFHLHDPAACTGYFTWNVIAEADYYRLYRTNPLPPQLIDNPIGLRYPPSDPNMVAVQNDEVYRILAANYSGDGPLSNLAVITGCMELLPPPVPFELAVGQPSPCQGSFSWGEVTGAEGYRLYEATAGLIADVGPTTTTYGPASIGNGQVYTVRAYESAAEGQASAPIIVSGCQPDAPANLTFHLDQGTPPCLGHLTWDDVPDADEYRVYRNGSGYPGSPEAAPTTARYPAAAGSSTAVANGDLFQVTAYNVASGIEGDPSQVTVAGCWMGSEVLVRYWLHSNPTPPNWHGDAPPPLTMNETSPYHDTLYNYNGSDPAEPGREVDKGGGTPPGETDPDDYLAWYSPSPNVPMTFRSDVTLYLWGRNTENQVLVSSAYLYSYNGSTYTLLGSATREWQPNEPAPPEVWRAFTLTFDTYDPGTDTGDVLPAGSQLVVWVLASGAKELHYAYDTQSFPSRVEFTGRW